jgi:dimethylargininase
VPLALTRAVPPSISQCELTHIGRHPIDHARAVAQHRNYERALVAVGCQIVAVPAAPDLPDSVFVEDTAVVLDEVAVITRPGAASRRGETVATAEVLAAHRALVAIETPGTLEGGDVLRVGRRLFVGASSRSNPDGLGQLDRHARRFGYEVVTVPLRGCLHLKSAVTLVAPDTIVVNPAWVDAGLLGDLHVVEVDAREPFAANALLVGDRVIFPAAHARTRDRLAARGVVIESVDVSELAKAEGGVTCCSLIVE